MSIIQEQKSFKCQISLLVEMNYSKPKTFRAPVKCTQCVTKAILFDSQQYDFVKIFQSMKHFRMVIYFRVQFQNSRYIKTKETCQSGFTYFETWCRLLIIDNKCSRRFLFLKKASVMKIKKLNNQNSLPYYHNGLKFCRECLKSFLKS